MKVKLDENIPNRLADELAALEYDVDTVAAEGLKGKEEGLDSFSGCFVVLTDRKLRIRRP